MRMFPLITRMIVCFKYGKKAFKMPNYLARRF
uniref:Uncharacterized protein n=1 Tax=Rhizophora mucronata TaxID=61149 RepID=A0A2P2K0J4_RHIMU